jgi:hypothetical protein
MTWAQTPWGLICQTIADDVTAAYPQFSIGIGPDPDDLDDMTDRITFVVLDGSITDPRYGGSDETHPTFDEELPIRIRIHTKTTLDTITNYDTSPLLAEAVKEKLLESIDANRHVPYFNPQSIARRGGRIGEAGTTIIIGALLRVENNRTPAIMATPLAATIGLTVEGPDGDGGTIGESFEVIGVP